MLFDGDKFVKIMTNRDVKKSEKHPMELGFVI